MAKRRKKGHARRGKGKKGHSLRRRYGRSSLPSAGGIRMNVTGTLQLDPESLETVIEEAARDAVEDAVEDSVPEAVEDAVEDAVEG